MYTRQPLHSHGLRPDEIINENYYRLLEEHYLFSLDLTVDNFNSKMKKKFTVEQRSICANSYEILRENGIIPDGIDAHGKIKWCLMLKGDVQIAVERYMIDIPENPTKNEIEKMKSYCRTRFHSLSKKQDERST